MKYLLLHENHKYVASQPTLRRRLYTHFQILIGWSIYLHLGSFGVNVSQYSSPDSAHLGTRYDQYCIFLWYPNFGSSTFFKP